MTEKEALVLALAEAAFRDHPLGTDENVKTMATRISEAIDNAVAEIERDADK